MPIISGRQVDQEAFKDILELEQKIGKFQSGSMLEDKFKAYRLTRGVYGQRQLGVHMFRIKIPYGRVTAEQLIRMADISEKYTNGNLHLTTRQNIQYHHIKLNDTPAIWAELAEKDITAREACGNTVRNLTASSRAGIDPNEPFDVSPYVYESFRYFLRNPICQDMGRKIKPAFSSSENDSAFTYFHDFGFIPRLQEVDGNVERGFKVVVAGGLGAQSIIAETAYEFLPASQIIPFMEAAIRVFDRYGERSKRFKARMKYLVKQLGLDGFMELVEKERKAIKNKEYPIDLEAMPLTEIPAEKDFGAVPEVDEEAFELWKATNTFEQKQQGFYGVEVRVPLGDISSPTARAFADLVKAYAADDIRLTINQGMLLRFVRPEALKHLYAGLIDLGLGLPGFDSVADITACPGTDTCNLAVTNSTGLTDILEQMIVKEFPHLLHEKNIKIKISGCMNSCGQHMAASIGFHGSSIKKDKLVVPAMQVVLGGGVAPDGKGFIAEKVIKLPTKRIPQAVHRILSDYEAGAEEGQYFNDYFQVQGKAYFYQLLKPLAVLDTLDPADYFDWGQTEHFIPEVGVGECAGVSHDVVGSILADAEEKLSLASESLAEDGYADSIYHSYSGFVIAAKGLLLAKDVKCNTHIGILKDFDTHYIQTGELTLETSFQELVLQINQNEPSEAFASAYLKQSKDFFERVHDLRKQQVLAAGEKQVIDNYYKA